eukprot:TRINITY_DN37919_c0_g1_i1.p1 TRINITY_DN37919_c0_g1~~TRINITY_DN37919_c0_g1_i1.p1  ORF type:complete len:251 (-),score=53.97 TRINITY_DN37919_c0_g1_i1:34-786(-)
MAQRPTHVPKFGVWKEEASTPYTDVFETARAAKGSRDQIINPNDPEQNPIAFVESIQKTKNASRLKPSTAESAISSKPPQPRRGTDSAVKHHLNSKQSHRGDNGYLKHHIESASNKFVTPARKSFGESPAHQHAGHHGSAGSSKTNSAGERRVSMDGGSIFSPSTPTRKQRGRSEANEMSSLPKFGSWNEDPALADGFTIVFDRAREERQHGGTGKIPPLASEDVSHDSSNVHKKDKQKKSWCCCWCADS